MRRVANVLLVLTPALLAAALFARGAGDLFAMISFPPSTATVVPMPVPSATPTETKHTPVAAPLPPRPEVVIAPCAIASRVVVVVSDEDRPERSMAVLTWPGAMGFDRPMVRRGSVIGGHRVAAITGSRVWLEDRGRTCFLDSATEHAPPKTPVVVATKGIDR